ncbi:ATP-dependent RNA helicase DHH1-like [Actinidia eriantha]|uniref:ATP-dependent RNA helicase DHH1-like n=1 Tax=Actinidia eriantha TaxID=165200 RepID=UPI002586E850|nr:ATP-dependent RNA helicase DHH1-like [Actinidia eriantha]
MDCSTQQQQQQNHDPAEAQAYDQSTQAYYEFHQYNQYIQQQQYPYYTTHDYTNPHQQTHQEPTSIYPPGVHITPEQTHLQNQQLGQTHVQDQYNSYYPQGFVDQQPLQQQVNGGGLGPQPQIGPTTYAGGGRRGGRPFRGGGPGRFGSRPNGSGPPLRGRGRGRGHGGRFPPPADNATACAQGESSQTPVWPPPRMAWCELCRVDCNTPEILEQHKMERGTRRTCRYLKSFTTVVLLQDRMRKMRDLRTNHPQLVENKLRPSRKKFQGKQN